MSRFDFWRIDEKMCGQWKTNPETAISFHSN